MRASKGVCAAGIFLTHATRRQEKRSGSQSRSIWAMFEHAFCGRRHVRKAGRKKTDVVTATCELLGAHRLVAGPQTLMVLKVVMGLDGPDVTVETTARQLRFQPMAVATGVMTYCTSRLPPVFTKLSKFCMIATASAKAASAVNLGPSVDLA